MALNKGQGLRVLLVADGRSPTTLSWLNSLLQLGYDVRMISSYPCARPPGLTDFAVIPLAFSQFSTPAAVSSTKKKGRAKWPAAPTGQPIPADFYGRPLLVRPVIRPAPGRPVCAKR